MTKAIATLRKLKGPMVSMIDARKAGLTDNTLWDLVGTSQIHIYRHDFPAGMTAEERKAALVWHGVYYNALSLRA